MCLSAGVIGDQLCRWSMIDAWLLGVIYESAMSGRSAYGWPVWRNLVSLPFLFVYKSDFSECTFWVWDGHAPQFSGNTRQIFFHNFNGNAQLSPFYDWIRFDMRSGISYQGLLSLDCKLHDVSVHEVCIVLEDDFFNSSFTIWSSNVKSAHSLHVVDVA